MPPVKPRDGALASFGACGVVIDMSSTAWCFSHADYACPAGPFLVPAKHPAKVVNTPNALLCLCSRQPAQKRSPHLCGLDDRSEAASPAAQYGSGRQIDPRASMDSAPF